MPGSGSVLVVRCPACSSLDDKVVDSRTSDEGAAIRRRRECLSCSRRFTTFERVEEVPVVVEKRSGHRVPFDRERIIAGVRAAAKNRPVSAEAIEALAAEIEESVKIDGAAVVASERIGLEVLERLRHLDDVAYLRFASVYKGFADLEDFQREAVALAKSTEPKPPPR